MKSRESVDLQDSLGSSIRIDVYGNKVVRILPVSNAFINEDWITNAARFSHDALDTQRLLSPMLKIYEGEEIRYIKTSWLYTFNILKNMFERYKFETVNNILDVTFPDIESLIAWKDLIHGLGMPINSEFYGKEIFDIRSNFLFRPTINYSEKIENVSCVGVELLPLIKSRLRNSVIYYLGNSSTKKSMGHYNILHRLAYGTNNFRKKMLKMNCLIMFGLEEMVNYSIFKLLGNKTGMKASLLQWKAGFTGASDIGIPPLLNFKGGNKTLSYFVNSEEPLSGSRFTIYQGYYGGRENWDVILPSKNFVEEKGIYANIEGLLPETKKVLTASINTRSDWEIFIALKLYLDGERRLRTWHDVKISSYGKFKLMARRIKQVLPLRSFNKFSDLTLDMGMKKLKGSKKLINNNGFNYHNKNIVLRNSKIMNMCASESYKLHYTYA